MQLRSKWALDVDLDNPLPEYPRPQLVRPNWMNLNGIWDASVHDLKNEPDFSDTIVVPFPIGSELSGFNHVLQPDEVISLRRFFHNPPLGTDERLRIHFGAVDWSCKKLAKMHSMVIETRDTRREREEKTNRPDRLSLNLISGPSDRPRPIDLSRARRRTHGTHVTRRVRVTR